MKEQTGRVLLAVMVALGAEFASVPSVWAGPVNTTATPAAKVEEIEKAGNALMKGQVDEAYRLLQEAVRKKPDLPPARLMLARLLLSSREGAQQGRATLETALTENPDHPEAYLTNASLALAENRFADTILNAERAIALAGADRWTADQKRGFVQQARSNLSLACEARRDWPETRKQLTALLEFEPRNGKMRTRLATALFFLDKPDEAHAELQQAVRDDPLLEPPTISMARLYAVKNDPAKSREWFEKAIKAEPNNTRAHLAYADWLLQQNDLDQSKQQADAALKLRPDDLEVLRMQGQVARVRRDLTKAEQIFRKILNDSPGDFFSANQLALVMIDQTDKEQQKRATQLAEMNARQYPKSPEALATLGYVYHKSGNLEGAAQALQSAVSGGQVSPDMAYFLARFLFDRDKADEARKVLKNALEARGLFVYRTEAKALLDKIAALKPETKPEEKEKPKTP